MQLRETQIFLSGLGDIEDHHVHVHHVHHVHDHHIHDHHVYEWERLCCLGGKKKMELEKKEPCGNLRTYQSHAKDFKRKELRRLQEESASPMLKKVESQETEVKVNLEDMKKEEGCFSKGASAGGSSIFTPRSSPSDVATPTFDSSPLPTMPPSPPSFVWLPTPPYTTFYSPRPWDLMPGHQWLICGACHSWGNVIMS